MIDIGEQERFFDAAKKLKGEDKLQSFKKIKTALHDFFRECAADFTISYDRVVSCKKLADKVDAAVNRAEGRE